MVQKKGQQQYDSFRRYYKDSAFDKAELRTAMPDIPPEILTQILTHVWDNDGPDVDSPDYDADDDGPDDYGPDVLDILSCSMVSRFWFDCAWPFAAKFFTQNQPLDLDAYSTVQLSIVVDAISKLHQLGVWKSTLTSVMTAVNNQLFEQTAHGSRGDIILRLIHALQPPSKALEIHIPYNFSAKQAANLQDFVSKLYSDTTSLRISGGRYIPTPLEPLEPLEPSEHSEPLEPSEPSELFEPSEPLTRLNILIHDLRYQLQDIIITGTYPPSFIQALSSCPNIRSVSINSTSNLNDISAAVFKWPELRSLKILGDTSEIDPIVEQLALNTPKHLESLHFDHCNTPQLRNLIISLAPRLVHLVLPSQNLENLENSEELLDLIASLDMPCLQHLDLSSLPNSLTAKNVIQRHWVEGQNIPMSLLCWPKLQRINLRFCRKISPLFLKLVMASCPALDGVRFGNRVVFPYSKDSEKMLEKAGWTKNTRYIGYGYCGYTYTTAVTFMRPGGNMWEAEAWVDLKETKVMKKKLEFPLKPEAVDGIVVVRCIGIGYGNETC